MTSTRSHVPIGQDGPRRAAVERLVRRHLEHPLQRPLAEDRWRLLDELRARLGSRRTIIDAGCGTGRATIALALREPDACVVGIDKSVARLDKARSLPPNASLVHADLRDVWTYAARSGWTVDEQLLLYPNPWPKPGDLGRRLYGQATFGPLLAFAPRLELRTNWAVYAEEFAWAVEVATGQAVAIEPWHPTEPISAFERKYAASGHALWRVRVATVSTPGSM